MYDDADVRNVKTYQIYVGQDSEYLESIEVYSLWLKIWWLCFEVCRPSCVFKLEGEVNSVKNTTMNIWLNDGVY